MTPEQLKSSILQYAIQGKLVEQRSEEGTGEELFAQIQEEKKRLIAEKKIKKEKPLPASRMPKRPFTASAAASVRPSAPSICRFGTLLQSSRRNWTIYNE